MQDDADSPPRAPPIKYTAPLGTRWAKEKAAAGGAAAFDLPTDPKNIGPWILGECIGKGASGRVKIARHRRTRQLAAVKILPITPLVNSRASLATQQAKSEKQRLGIDREITMMKLMNHPNIMRIYDVYEGEKELFLVLEYVEGGELFDFLVNRGRLPPNEALLYFRQIIYGLNYAHTFSIIHRDLKPENILIASLEPPIIKIADWGMAAFAPPSLQLETSCGSPHYASPEIVNGEKYFGTATDIWSCGVILYALLTGRLPFDDKNVRTLLSKVKSGKYEMPTWIDPLARDLLTRMLVVDVRKRITIPEVIAHPWFTKLLPSSSQTTSSPQTAPVLPPSPSILARPIPSPDMIDPELFLSLRVIWGRHAESQTASIQRDLCSPAGHGTYAKAFYFLLNKYRQETLRSRYDDAEAQHARLESDSDIDPGATRLNQNWESNTGRRPVSREVMSPRAQNASHTIPLAADVSEMADPPLANSKAAKMSDESNQLPPVSGHGAPQPGRVALEPRKPNTLLYTTQGGSRPSATVANHHNSRVLLPRKLYHPHSASQSQSPSEMRRSTGPVVSPATRSIAGTQRSASDITDRHYHGAELRSSVLGGGYPSHLPLRSPTFTHPSKLASSSAMDVDSQAVPLSLRAGNGDVSAGGIIERVNDVVQAASNPSGHQSMMAVIGTSGNYDRQSSSDHPGVVDSAVTSVGNGRARNPIADKENVPTGEGWTRVDSNPQASGPGFGAGKGNRDSLIPIPATTKGKKEKERKGRPPPLELMSNQQRRNILGSPIQVTSPIMQGPPSSRIMASPVVGEFRGWFSNLFNWKPGGSASQPSVFYSMEDGPHTRDLSFALFQSMGFIISRNLAEQTSEVYHCRLDQFVSDPQTNLILKPNRFRVEFCFIVPTPPPTTFPPPSPAPTSVDGSNAYFVSSPIPSPNYLATPTPQGFSFRPRHSLIMGGGRSSSLNTPTTASGLSTPMGPPGPWEMPPGCSCVITLAHEKGSTSTFKTVRERLKDVFDAQGISLSSCFSPPIPNTPAFQEGAQQQQQRLAM